MKATDHQLVIPRGLRSWWVVGDYAAIAEYSRSTCVSALSEATALLVYAALDEQELYHEADKWLSHAQSSAWNPTRSAIVYSFLAQARLKLSERALYSVYPAVALPHGRKADPKRGLSSEERLELLDTLEGRTVSPSAREDESATVRSGLPRVELWSDKPLVSLVVPVFNTSTTLERCLESISAQTFSDFEILAVDDCSTDDSLAKLKVYSAREPRLRILQHDRNRGLGAARNTGIQHARGEFLGGVDSDDSIHPRMLELLVASAQETGADVVAAGYEEIGRNGEVIATRTFADEFIHNSNNTWDLFRVINPAFWNKLWCKSLFTSNGITFPRTYFEDLATTPLLLSKANALATISYVGYRYHNTEGSITFSFTPRHLADYLSVFRRLRSRMACWGLMPLHKSAFAKCVIRSLRYTARRVVSSNQTGSHAEYLRHTALLKKALASQDSLLLADEQELLKIIAA